MSDKHTWEPGTMHEHDGYAAHSHAVRADHLAVKRDVVTERYTYGYNYDGSGTWSVLRVHANDLATPVLAGANLTEDKVKAIALILNAPDLY